MVRLRDWVVRLHAYYQTVRARDFSLVLRPPGISSTCLNTPYLLPSSPPHPQFGYIQTPYLEHSLVDVIPKTHFGVAC